MGQAAWTHHDKSAPQADTCSQVQQDLWYAERLELPGAGAHLALALRIHGDLDEAALRAACADLVEAQPDLLSRFPARQGRPERTPLDDDAARRAVEVVRLADEAAVSGHLRAPFDLDTGPLLRFGVTDEGGRTTLLAVFHHLVADGSSRDLIAQEWIRCHRARRHGQRPVLRPAEAYQRHVDRERALLANGPPPGWRDAFAWDGAAISDVLHSPPDAVASPVAVRLGVDRSARLGTLAEDYGVSRHAVLLASFAATLASYATAPGPDVPPVAVPMGTRTAEFAGTVGPFVNEAPLRLAPGRRDNFGTFLRRVRQQTATAYRFRSFPLTDLRRRVGSTPWRPSVVFGYRRAGLPERIRTPELTVDYQAVVPVGHTSAELELQLLDRGTDLGGWLDYDPARFAAGPLRDVLDHWYRMIDLVTAAPDRPLRSLCVLDERQQRRVGALSTGPEVRFDGPDTVHDLIAAQAAATPEGVAVRDDGRSVSYAELDRDTSRVAGLLAAAGVRADQPVLVCVPRSVGLVAALLGVWR
ncbi:MAG: condensation domain-containing protein, partial [Actinocatenispora sp.]